MFADCYHASDAKAIISMARSSSSLSSSRVLKSDLEMKAPVFRIDIDKFLAMFEKSNRWKIIYPSRAAEDTLLSSSSWGDEMVAGFTIHAFSIKSEVRCLEVPSYVWIDSRFCFRLKLQENLQIPLIELA